MTFIDSSIKFAVKPSQFLLNTVKYITLFIIKLRKNDQ